MENILLELDNENSSFKWSEIKKFLENKKLYLKKVNQKNFKEKL